MPEHPRRNPVRRAQEPRAAVDHASLQDIRDQLSPAPEGRAAAPTGTALPGTVPPALLAMVEEHARHVNKYWSRAMQAGRQYHDYQGEWQRLVLYHLTDALAHNFLAVGTIAAYLQQHGTDEDLVRRYLQSPHPDRYVTRHALDHLTGLIGPLPGHDAPEPTWTFVGREIARQAQASDGSV